MNRYLSGIAMAVAVALPMTGCGDKKGAKDAGQGAKTAKHDEHDHHDEGPHGGHIIELGDEFHAELVHDDQAQSVTVYLLGADLKKPIFSDEQEITLNFTVNGDPQQFKVPAAKAESDPEGLFSRYETKDAKLGEALDAPDNKGRIRVSIGGEPYDVEIEHKH